MWDPSIHWWMSWELGPIPAPLPREEVHVRVVRLTDAADVLPALQGFLNSEENARHARFRYSHDRDQFTLGRAGLRALLAQYYRTSPAEVPIRHTREGKPLLEGYANPHGLSFNVSHAGGLVVWAFSRDRLVGIDTEPVRTIANEAEVVADFFSPEEVTAYRELPEAERTRGFLRMWTRKEAVLKAVGVGLPAGLASFAVTLTPTEPARVLRGEVGGIEAGQWSLHDLEIDPGHITAVAVHGPNVRLRAWPDGRVPAPRAAGEGETR